MIATFITGVVIGALIALAIMNRQLSRAWATIAAQQEDIDSLFEITPLRLPNGRFAKRQEHINV
jgi:hypothetical protein